MLRINSHKITHTPIKKEKKERSKEETSNLSLVSAIC